MENLVEGQRLKRYWCHACNAQVQPTEGNLTCSECNGDFIEELEDGAFEEDADIDDDEDEELGFNAPMNAGNAEVFANFHNMLFQHLAQPNHGQHNPFGNVAFFGPHVPPGQNAQNTPPSNNAEGAQQRSPVAGVAVTLGPDGVAHAPMNLNTLLQQLFSANMFGGPNTFDMFGNPGDYVFGQRGLDDIITRLMEQERSHSTPPASQEVLDSLPKIQVSQQQVDDKSSCAICKDEFNLDESVRQLPLCVHDFHEECIFAWLKQNGTCPICRKNVTPEAPSESKS